MSLFVVHQAERANDTQDGLWWLPLPAPQQTLVRRLLLLLSLVAALAGLEGRVLFRAFGQYMGLQPPWSYVVVSFALYCGAALSVLYLAGTCNTCLLLSEAPSYDARAARCMHCPA